MSVWGTESWESEESYEKRKKGPIDRIDKKTVISVLSGAGISAESGVPTFRGAGGLWENESLMRIATPQGFAEDPVRGWRFYDERRVNMVKALPNPAHRILAALEKAGYDVVIITQNVDRLHQRAGSSRVIELHGSIWEFRCSNPSCRSAPFENHDVPLKEIPPLCASCGSFLRPNVVFFEEALDPVDIQQATLRAKASDLFLVVGTSGVVYPAAAFAGIARMADAYVVEFNVEKTVLTPCCHETFLGPCGETLPAFISRLTGGEVTL